MPLLLCPNCNTSMQAVSRSGVELDMCPSCRGVWLDRGELEKLVSDVRQVQQADVQSREKFDREVETFHRDPEACGSRPDDDREKRHRYDDDHQRHHKKKRGFDLFDIFD